MRRTGIKNGSITDQAYDFIADHIRKKGRRPSDQLVADHLGWRTTSGVSEVLLNLCVQGRLRRVPSTRVGRRYEYELTETEAVT